MLGGGEEAPTPVGRGQSVTPGPIPVLSGLEAHRCPARSSPHQGRNWNRAQSRGSGSLSDQAMLLLHC